MRNWIRRLFGQKAQTPKHAAVAGRPIRHEMTLERWQTDRALVNWARTSDEFAFAVSAAINRQPVGYPIRGQMVTEIQCAVELGRKEGYSDCLSVLLSLKEFPTKVLEEVPADYDNTDYKIG